MASFLLVLLVTLMVTESQAGLAKFRLMVEAATRRSALLSFAFYGCYCGLGGQGWPVDAIDWCCQRHDCCYGVLMKAGCSPLSQDYNFSHINGDITCDDEDLDGYARATCECDRAISHCFREFSDHYSRKNNYNFYRKNCWGNALPCGAGPTPDVQTTYSDTEGSEPDQIKGVY